MNLFARLFTRKTKEFTYDQIAGLIDQAATHNAAGVMVTEKSALEVSTVLGCVRVISDGCATPALHVFRQMDDGTTQKATDRPEYRLLARRPNEWQTSVEWRRQMTLHAALCGAGLSIKAKGINGRLRELIPVQPGRWDVTKTSRYERVYRCWDEFGLIGEFSDDDVFLIPGMQWDSTTVWPAVNMARSSIGLAIATERSQASMHKNGLRTSGVYSVDGTLTEEQHTRLTQFLKRKSGPDATGTPLILDRGAKWMSSAMSGVDAQHVETRRLQVEEICRAFGVFPQMVGHTDKASTFASAEAFFKAHLVHTLKPWHEVWKQRLDETLLDGSGPLFANFDTTYMTQGNEKDHAVWVRTMAEMGVLTRNEIRQGVGLDPLPGLDDPLTPMNMTTGDSAEADDDEKTN